MHLSSIKFLFLLINKFEISLLSAPGWYQKLSKSFSTSSLVILKPVFGGTTKLIMDGTSFRNSTLSYDFIPAI